MADVERTPVTGWVVLCFDAEGQWHADWDGWIHLDRPLAERELASAQTAGWPCVLAKLTQDSPVALPRRGPV